MCNYCNALLNILIVTAWYKVFAIITINYQPKASNVNSSPISYLHVVNWQLTSQTSFVCNRLGGIINQSIYYVLS